MQVLVTGSHGQLGRELMDRGSRCGFIMQGIDIEDLDISDPGAVSAACRDLEPALVVNAAAYTAVDQAETDAAAAFAVNCDGPRNLADACAERAIPLIHISTDYVYAGTKDGAYVEDDPVEPMGVYARSKAAGDATVAARLGRHIILRTAWLYSVYGRNFVKTMLRLGREREIIRVVDDQFGCPTDAADLAQAVLHIAGQLQYNAELPWGTYHYCGKGRTNWWEFAKKIFEIAEGYEKLAVRSVEAVPSSEYPTPARRPANSVLDCSKIEDWMGISAPPWADSLARMLRRLYAFNGS